MSTPLTLRRLYSLDTSSPDFLRHVYSLFRHDKEEGYLSTLQGSELTRLIDFLDEVRTLPPSFHQFYETGSTDPQCHFCQPRDIPAMSIRATSYLWPPRNPTILMCRI